MKNNNSIIILIMLSTCFVHFCCAYEVPAIVHVGERELNTCVQYGKGFYKFHYHEKINFLNDNVDSTIFFDKRTCNNQLDPMIRYNFEIFYDLFLHRIIRDWLKSSAVYPTLTLQFVHSEFYIYPIEIENNQWYYFSVCSETGHSPFTYHVTRYNSAFTKCVAVLLQIGLLMWICKKILPKLIA
ncbi:MAG TPA: hypothetical protein VL201_01585 [Patescibacteria group bacterium]|jgi:hypothetical protein|nr:hypothetical protein [Patescibacteria group bacterium]